MNKISIPESFIQDAIDSGIFSKYNEVIATPSQLIRFLESSLPEIIRPMLMDAFEAGRDRSDLSFTEWYDSVYPLPEPTPRFKGIEEGDIMIDFETGERHVVTSMDVAAHLQYSNAQSNYFAGFDHYDKRGKLISRIY